MRPHIRFAALLLSATIAACGSDSPTASSATPAGSYALATVNGKAPPQLVARTAAGDLEVVTASLTLRADRSYSSAYTYRAALNPSFVTSQTVDGTWTVSGNTVTYTPAGASPTTVTTMHWDDPTLTLVDNSGAIPVTLVFRK